jgi:hypothetical protein
MREEELGPMPEPQVECGEPTPGGVDAITLEMRRPVVPDLPVEILVDDVAVPEVGPVTDEPPD